MNFTAKLLFTLLVFLLVKQESDYIYQPLLTALGYFVSGVLSLVVVRLCALPISFNWEDEAKITANW